MDLALKKRVWRAQIQFHPDGMFTESKKLSNAILRALITDGLVQGPLPVEPGAQPTSDPFLRQ